MLVKGLNDSDGALIGLRQVIDEFRPDRIDILIPTRPPTEDWVTAPGPERILRAREVLGPCDVHVSESDGDFDVSDYTSASEALRSIGSRHLLREAAAERICRDLDEPDVLEELLACGDVVRVQFNDVTYLLPKQLAG
jgi:wyosine [tRNA(Phe)-imidazoG37] synthetase (radical SAM superfamily)